MSFGWLYIFGIVGVIYDGWVFISGFNWLLNLDYFYYYLLLNMV